jgi:hypothetical protein
MLKVPDPRERAPAALFVKDVLTTVMSLALAIAHPLLLANAQLLTTMAAP